MIRQIHKKIASMALAIVIQRVNVGTITSND